MLIFHLQILQIENHGMDVELGWVGFSIQNFTLCFICHYSLIIQNQPSKGILRKRRSENMQQNLQENTHLNHAWAWMFSCKFAAYFQSTFSQEHHWVSVSEYSYCQKCRQSIPSSILQNKSYICLKIKRINFVIKY